LKNSLDLGKKGSESAHAVHGSYRVAKEELVGSGLVSDYAELARLGQVSPARIRQIVGLNLLAPDIQEDILFLPPTLHGRDPLREPHVRPITAVLHWPAQRRMW